MNVLRPYQIDASAAVLKAWETARSTLLVMPTGCGKTRVMTDVLVTRAPEGRALFIAHRDELLTQACRALQRDGCLEVDLEQARTYADVHGGLYGKPSDVVVASVQTLRNHRLRRWPRDHFATVMIDEGHHATANTYRKIIDHFRTAKILGVTATPDRGDGVGLAGVFESVAFEYDIRDAIKDGWLCKIRQTQILCDDLDLSQVRSVRGDLSETDLQQAMAVDAVLHQIAGPLAKEAGERQTLVFVAGVDQAHAFAGVLGTYVGQDAVCVVDGKTPREERRNMLARYQSGDVQYVVNVGCLTEGFDAPKTACIAMARPTKSRALYAQMLGRGTRIAEDKADCLVLDFVGNSGKHKLVSSLDVLGGKDLPDDVRAEVERSMASGVDVEEAIADAEEAHRERLAKAEAERARRAVKAEVQYTKRGVDPFEFLKVRAIPDGPLATDKQVAYLEAMGVKLQRAASVKEAMVMLDRLVDRRKRGLCSYKQAVLLTRYGLPGDVEFGEAKAMIDTIANNGWRVPAEMRSRYAEAG